VNVVQAKVGEADRRGGKEAGVFGSLLARLASGLVHPGPERSFLGRLSLHISDQNPERRFAALPAKVALAECLVVGQRAQLGRPPTENDPVPWAYRDL
jgi:hypothetical protein